ncbi:hypothetical protein Q5O89_21230 [Peribacillus frigoritolerans]|nr:hypothetical protein [Peribacillus frigoritolerans]
MATLFPQESRTFRSNQLDFFFRNIVGKLALLSIRLHSCGSINFSAKGVSDCSRPEPSLRPGYPSCCFTVTLNGWKKYATLLPNNWLAETPQTLASRRLGRQSAERERISEIN